MHRLVLIATLALAPAAMADKQLVVDRVTFDLTTSPGTLVASGINLGTAPPTVLIGGNPCTGVSAPSLTSPQTFSANLPPSTSVGSYLFEVTRAGGSAEDAKNRTSFEVTVGAAGPVGPQGPRGPQGEDGIAGPQGPPGFDGARGPAGADGLPGAMGPGGPAGAQGPAGPQGLTGSQGPAGEQGPAGPAGSGSGAGGSGAAGKLALWSDATTLASSAVAESGGRIGIGTPPASGIRLDVLGSELAGNTALHTKGRVALSAEGAAASQGSVFGGNHGSFSLIGGGGNVDSFGVVATGGGPGGAAVQASGQNGAPGVLAISSGADAVSGEASMTGDELNNGIRHAGVHGTGDSFQTVCNSLFPNLCFPGLSGAPGVWGESADGSGVLGTSSNSTGVEGTGPVGVRGTGVQLGFSAGVGVLARSSSAAGSVALSAEAMGPGTKAASFAGQVSMSDGLDVHGFVNIMPGGNANPLVQIGATQGCNTSNGFTACRKADSATFDGPINVGRDGDPNDGWLVGSSGVSANFNGTVNIAADLNVAGGKHFRIDHPLDPGGKFLVHTSVESPDMKNIYDGLATLNEKGEAVIELPGYFEALNRDFRYQLTAVGAAAPGLHVAAKVSGNRFRIAGGAAGLEVSWQVTGIRHDAYATAHPAAVEQAKVEPERGRYLYPEGFGRPHDQAIAGR